MRYKKGSLLLLAVCGVVLVFQACRLGNRFHISKQIDLTTISRIFKPSSALDNPAIEHKLQDGHLDGERFWDRVSPELRTAASSGDDQVVYPHRAGADDDRERIFAARRHRVHEACLRYGARATYGGLEFVPFDRFRWFKQRNLVVCFCAKVGTTTWIQHLLSDGYPLLYELNKNFHIRAQHLLAVHYFVPEVRTHEKIIEQLMSSVKIVNVRHPFVRLVSAYRDKLEPCQGQSTCLFGEYFVKDRWWTLVDFKAFVEFLLETVPAAPEATALTYSSFDQHWRPFYLNCAVCDIDYDYIVTMETWDEDVRYILAKLGFTNTGSHHSNSHNSSSLALDYFRTLPRSLILELYRRYRPDFDMFGYTIDEFLA